MSIDHGKDLLFGVIALQMNFITQGQFVEVMTLLPGAKGKSAPAIFTERGYLKPKRVQILRSLLEEQLDEHEGDIEKSLAAFQGNAAVAESMVLVGAHSERGVSEATTQTIVLERKPDQRYVLGRELGRGGLGRVMLAMDRDLMSREVAMKLMLEGTRAKLEVRAGKPAGAGGGRKQRRRGGRGSSPGSTPPARARFLEEAQITGQLQHPNIISVHELGTRPSGELYYTMPVVSGKTLKKAIEEAHESLSSGETMLSAWGLKRMALLQSFQGLCHGISYAHSRGVIHRDIKPANVMVGEHGETIVVDWGLAKVIRKGVTREAGQAGDETVDFRAQEAKKVQADRELVKMIRSSRRVGWAGDKNASGYKTMEGTITGTPAYMPPEQARGEVGAMDERSDIYSIGAVLFEILTGRPPFVGETAHALLFQVMGLKEAPDPREYRERAPIPDDLADICVRAMAPKQRDRFQSVTELLADVVAAIEGGKERERRHAEAMRLVAAGRERAGDYEGLRKEYRRLEEAAKEEGKKFKGGEPLTEKAAWWKMQDEAKAVGQAILGVFAEAERLFHQALQQEHEHAGAREGLADLYMSQFRIAEAKGNEADFQYYQDLVRTYDDGKYARELSGEGGIAIETDPAGAEVYFYRYVEHERRLIPAPWKAEEGWKPVVEASGFQSTDVREKSAVGIERTKLPAAEGRRHEVQHMKDGEVPTSAGWYLKANREEEGAFLGEAPVARMEAGMGSYLAIIRKEGYRDVKRPIHVGRNEEVEVKVRLYREEEIGEGFVYVPGGPFLAGGDPELKGMCWPRGEREVRDFFIGRYPVTCGEYLEFLNDIGKTDPEKARRHAPRWEDQTETRHWIEEPAGVWRLPEGKDQHEMEWKAEELVVEVNWHDANAYCAWRTEREGREIRLPTEEEWEKAARGVDGRYFPWGNGFDATYCNMASSRLEGGGRRGPVGEFPVDESPYGVKDLGGNVMDWCEDLFRDDQIWRAVRGGCWYSGSLNCRSAGRYGDVPSLPSGGIGFRLAAAPGTEK